jgi:leader peptidase (prepilin peptidase)/N-methyltransferase
MQTLTRDRGTQVAAPLESVAPAVTISLAASLAAAVGSVVVGLAGAFTLAAWAATVDARERRIPDRLVVSAAIPIGVVVVVATVDSAGSPSIAAVLVGAVLLAGPLLAVHLVAPSAMGFGDVKLAIVLGAAVGVADWRWSVAALCIAAGLTVVVGLVRGVATLPFAPGLVVGASSAVVFVATMGAPAWR